MRLPDIEVKILLQKITDRKSDLDRAAYTLKKQFVGLDDVIDRIIRSIESWYCFPEIVSHPVIICLWGMTGVGKTDLVRKLVRALRFGDHFVEVLLDGDAVSKSSYWSNNTIRSILEASSIEEGCPGIILFDEVQRFRTIDQQGKETPQKAYQDLWTLLSDGKFSCDGDGKNELLSTILDYMYRMDRRSAANVSKNAESSGSAAQGSGNDETEDDEFIELTPGRKYLQTSWEAQSLKKKLKLSESVEEIMTWPFSTKIQKIRERIADPFFATGDDYSKCLIFICGNIDEAYTKHCFGEAYDCDVTADFLHKKSKLIDIVGIKSALMKRFRAEQISRFGNNHIIYPTLSEESFRELIRRKLSDVVAFVYKVSCVTLKLDKSIEDMIYRNGVYPSQGVRPVFSTISTVFETCIPNIIIECLKIKTLEVTIEMRDSQLVVLDSHNYVIYKTNLICDIDKIRSKNKNNLDQNMLISVHEAGHAIAYAALFDICPVQIVSSPITFSGGYNQVHQMNPSLRMTKKYMIMLLAGQCAEEIIFGRPRISSCGTNTDLNVATRRIAELIRHSGLGGSKAPMSYQLPESYDESHLANTDIKQTNHLIEEEIQLARKASMELLTKHLDLLKQISQKLIHSGSMSPEEFLNVCKPIFPTLQIVNPEETIYDKYTD